MENRIANAARRHKKPLASCGGEQEQDQDQDEVSTVLILLGLLIWLGCRARISPRLRFGLVAAARNKKPLSGMATWQGFIYSIW
jgi:hypothetical protein